MIGRQGTRDSSPEGMTHNRGWTSTYLPDNGGDVGCQVVIRDVIQRPCTSPNTAGLWEEDLIAGRNQALT
jgi:hypothetical protein